MVALQFGLDPHSPSQRIRGTRQEPREQETFCYEGDGPAECIPTRNRQYNECANLAAERGWQREAGRGYEFFIYQCLTGKVSE